MTTPSQKAFEAFLLGLYPKWDVRIAFAKRPDGEYASMSAHIGWLSWQAAEVHGRKQALEAVRKDAAWQPIETAPKDGTAILAIVSGVDSDGLAYEPSTVQIDGTQVHLFCDSDDDSWTELSEWELTHWMPLPKPPIAIKELLK